ncbi:hypothetical protein CsatB_022119 [Cannabis sativa]
MEDSTITKHYSLLQSLALLTIFIITKSTAADDHHQITLPGCPTRCGHVDIPYPFGLTQNCSLNKNFLLNCNSSTLIFGKNLTVTNISVHLHEITVNWFVARDCYNGSGHRVRKNRPALNAATLTVSSAKNKFVVLGCDSYAFLNGFENRTTNYSMGCMSICNDRRDVAYRDGGCTGIGCCEMDLPKRRLRNLSINPRSFDEHRRVVGFNPCTYAFVVERNGFEFSGEFLEDFPKRVLPVVADWRVKCQNGSFCGCEGENSVVEFGEGDDGSEYRCMCKEGYQGNPYLPTGCKGVAIGFIALFISTSWLYLVLKQRKLMQLKEKFFKQNGGLILKQKLSGLENNSSSSSSAKIFTEEELIKATNNYDDSTIIGRGGFGTVYKGFLPDNNIVAIKKSKIVDQNQTEQFINEERLFEIIEVEGNIGIDYKEQVLEVAMIAKRCLSVNGEDRPSMKEVAVKLEGLRKMEKHPWVNEGGQLINGNLEYETEYLLAHDQDNGNEDTNTNNSTYDSIRDHLSLDFSGR